jgi:hypothetical protein
VSSAIKDYGGVVSLREEAYEVYERTKKKKKTKTEEEEEG